MEKPERTDDAAWGLHASGPTGSGKLLVSGLLILTAILVSAAVNLCRTGHLTSDQFSIGSMIQKSQDPGLFAHDPVYSNLTNYDFYLPYYRRLLGWLMQITGKVSLAYWLLTVGISAVTLFGFWLLYLDLKVRPTWAALGAILSALPRLAPAQEITGACLMETALPRTFLSMFLPLVMLMFFRSRGRGWRCVLSFLAVGLLGNFHPQSAFFLTGVLLVSLLWHRLRELRGWTTAAAGGLASLVGISPFIITFQWLRVSGNSCEITLDRAPAAVGTLLFFGSRAVLGQIIAKAELHTNLLLFLMCVLPMFVAVWFAKRLVRDGADCVAARMSWRSALIVGVLGLTGGLMSLLSLVGFHGWLVSLHWLRAMRLVAPLAMIAVVLLVNGIDFSVGRAKRRLVWIVMLVLLPTAMTILGLEYVYFQRYYPLKAVALRAARETPTDSLILTEPVGGCAFRVWSKRSVVWTQADKNFVMKSDRKALREFCSCLSKAYKKKKTQVLMSYAMQCGADYVVVPARGVEDWIVDSSSGRRRYQLRRVRRAEEDPDDEGRHGKHTRKGVSVP